MAKHSRLAENLLQDIREYGEKARSFLAGGSKQEFLQDEKTQLAVFRCIEVMGEAASKLPRDFQDRHPDVPWHKIIGMRNILVHDYFEVDVERVWDTVQDNIPELMQYLDSIDVT